jgi:spermidine dehydrogenase
MTTKKRARELGMHRDITRRDFINGIAISLLGASTPRVFARAPLPADYYPPSLTGLRGSHAGSFEVAHGLRGGGLHNFPRLDSDTGEAYDLVVVGGGLSGLSAAIFFRESFGDDKKVLILDNHDDFGGHAKRNEFRHDGRLFIGYGGTMGISTSRVRRRRNVPGPVRRDVFRSRAFWRGPPRSGYAGASRRQPFRVETFPRQESTF